MSDLKEFSIEVPFERVQDWKKFKAFVEHYGCKVKKGKNNHHKIITTDPINFFWLGSNMSLKWK